MTQVDEIFCFRHCDGTPCLANWPDERRMMLAASTSGLEAVTCPTSV